MSKIFITIWLCTFGLGVAHLEAENIQAEGSQENLSMEFGKPQVQEPKKNKAEKAEKTEKNTAKRRGAKLHFLETNHNFGDVARKGGDLIHEFKFVNEGDVPLVLTRVITSCSCLSAGFSKRPVAPGDTATLRIVYEPQKSEPGRFNKVIRVYSNSAKKCAIVTVQGNALTGSYVRKVKNGKLKLKNY